MSSIISQFTYTFHSFFALITRVFIAHFSFGDFIFYVYFLIARIALHCIDNWRISRNQLMAMAMAMKYAVLHWITSSFTHRFRQQKTAQDHDFEFEYD